VVHLHGLVEPGKEFCVTESDLRQPTPQFKELMVRFHVALNRDVFVFAGYSMRDMDIASVYWQVWDQWKPLRPRGNERKKTYIVGLAVHGKEREMLEKLWDARGAVFLDMDAAQFVRLLSEELRMLWAKEVEPWLVDLYGGAQLLDQELGGIVQRHNLTRPEAVSFLANLIGRPEVHANA
jgi:hypothetical protein